ncbi:DUF6512 family protein [Clostridium sp. D53t1_180928_C8]|uniref:DUF6512 family protein n=1 Tax=Clostridium sp. D53t1_180928_C8 TaxID=2787101 RepID=UPI0018AADD90|nr:DUF6512 family protein [Clostridium sp. D53t1_180928_C8]
MNKFLVDDYRSIKKNIILSIPILFIIGTPIHFLYDLTGEMAIVGAITPVNESVVEHFKLATIPLVLWWSISYCILRKKVNIDFRKWIFSAAISVLIIPIVITNFYYTYKGALGFSSFILDVFSLFLALIIGQILALNLYKNSRSTNIKLIIGILIILLIIGLTIFFTFYPIHIPMFRDGNTGLYGI